jgi:lipopolysaccharide biosynthesis glycosyltransferase
VIPHQQKELLMTQSSPIRVFIGSGEASLLERKTLIHSLRKHTRRELDIYVFNGTHNAIERNDEAPILANMPLWIKYRNYTEFSNYRWLIPAICNHQGRAIFLDSDMVCLSDIGELFDSDMQGCDMLAKAEAYKGDDCWGMSNILFDCAKCHFDLEKIFHDIDQGLFTSTDFHQMSPRFLAHYPFQLGPLNPQWNSFDHRDEQTRLIHYTNLRTQPWKFPGHPHEGLWFQYFQEARKSGLISNSDVDKTLSRAYARQDILAPQAKTAATGKAGMPTQPAPSTFKLVKTKLRRMLGITKKKAA